jgi:glycosyltransferase involved in cell wall biosynthesis
MKPNKPSGQRVRFLSTNRPDERMGMAHYERLLIHHVLRQAQQEEQQWRFGITFDGRGFHELQQAMTLEPGLKDVDFLGLSTNRLRKLPWSVTGQLINRRFKKGDSALYHSLSLNYPLPSVGARGVFSIHDLPPARFPDEGTVPPWAKRAAQSAQAIIAPSQFGKNEVVELLEVPEERVHVIYCGWEEDRFNLNVEAANAQTLAQHGINTPFLIYVGGFTQRKNVRNMLTAWKMLASQYPDLSLVMVGYPTFLQALANEYDAPRVIVPGYMERDTLPSVLKAATALVFPSIYEGFGLPPQEAMAMGVPVVAVRTGGAIPEVVGDAAVLAEDGSAPSLAGAVQRLLDDSDLAARLRSAGPEQVKRFSWSKHAKQVLDLYEQVLN